MYQTADIRKGLRIEMDGAPWVIVDFQFVKPGKGCAFTRVRIKNLLNGNVLDRTFKTGESLEPAEVEEVQMQYLFNDGEGYTFMKLSDFDQISIPADVLGDSAGFLLEEMQCRVMLYKGRPVSVELPTFVELEITYTEPGAKGNTATNVTKAATLSTGAVVNVPLFIEQGTVIRIDTRTGEYVGRVNN